VGSPRRPSAGPAVAENPPATAPRAPARLAAAQPRHARRPAPRHGAKHAAKARRHRQVRQRRAKAPPRAAREPAVVPPARPELAAGRRPVAVAAIGPPDGERPRRLALAGGALLALSIASFGLLVVARAGGRARAWGER